MKQPQIMHAMSYISGATIIESKQSASQQTTCQDYTYLYIEFDTWQIVVASGYPQTCTK